MNNIGKSIGIDLGTTNSLAAIVDGDGNPRILETGTGESFTPSVVSFSQGTLLVGRQAWNNANKAPTDTIFSIKRLMGRSADDENVKKLKEKSPHSIIQHPNNEIKVLINGVEYTPEDVSEMILRQVVEDARAALGVERITHAVITVPAYFSEPQRLATRKAGEKAGLVIKKIIDEPTAAAVAFGMNQPEEFINLLVFDMGGGTTDVSLLYVGNREFVGDAITGDMWLGGDNFDNKIVDIIIDWVKQTYGVDPSQDKDFRMAASRKAETTKILLSNHPQASVLIPDIVPLGGGKKGPVTMTISRAEFEARISDEVKKGIDLVLQLMKDPRLMLSTEDISGVLLVGGATYIPLVRKKLEEIFGEDKVRHDVNPMQAVALGAAILADQLKGTICPQKECQAENPYEAEKCQICGTSLITGRTVGGVGLHEVTERDFGIGAVNENDEPDAFSVLIKAGTPYPLKEPMQRRYMTTSREIVIPVYVGDKPKASENEYLGRVEYELPPDFFPKTPVTVSFNYDRNRILTVGIEVVGRPELKHKTTPKRYAADPAKEGEDKSWTRLRNEIEFVDTMSKDYGEFFEPGQKQEIEIGLQNARQVLRQKEQASVENVLGKLNQIIENNSIVTSLHLSDRLMLEVDSRTSQFLAEQSKSLRDAYRQNPRDMEKVNRIQKVLQTEIMQIFENFKLSPEVRTYGGMLKVIGDTGKNPVA